MRLKITNFAKVKEADIRLDGITVIAGENNTGKSTIGKVLYSTFNSMYDIDTVVEKSRRDEIVSRSRSLLRNFLLEHGDRIDGYGTGIVSSSRVSVAVRQFNDKLLREEEFVYDMGFIEFVLRDTLDRNRINPEALPIYELLDDINYVIGNVMDTEHERIVREIVDDLFNSVFGNQINNLANHERASVTLTLKGKDVEFGFEDNECTIWDSDINILHEAFLIDDPFILDDLGELMMEGQEPRSQLLGRLGKNSRNSNIVNTVLVKEKLAEIADILNKVVPASVNSDGDEWSLNDEKYSEPIRLNNLSAGLKSFVLLKLMLERGILNEKDVLILDEPEIHLHPEWQIKYAEIIILLQKKFDLTIVVTTHSRDFFEALELFSRKHRLEQKCSFYLAENGEDGVKFVDVTENNALVYKQLVTPGRLLDKLKFELEEMDDD